MESKLHQNAILTGWVDAYCLICESLLRPDDVISHIYKPIHKKNLEFNPHVEKYKGDHIRKVKKGYYCEFCNTLIPTATKVKLHITEPTHKESKRSEPFKRIGNTVIGPNDVIISDKAWNGLIEETCALCNVEYMNERIHKTEQQHILNLIQKKVVVGSNDAIYRMVDDETFQCLTCNQIFSISTVLTHFIEDSHKKMLEKWKDIPEDLVAENKDPGKNTNKPEAVTDSNKDPVRINNKPENVSDYKKKDSKESPKKPKEKAQSSKEDIKYESKTNVNVMLKCEEAMRQVMRPHFSKDFTDEDQEIIDEDPNVINEDGDPDVTNEDPKEAEKDPEVAGILSEFPELAKYEQKSQSAPVDLNDPFEFAKEHKLTYHKGELRGITSRPTICNTKVPGNLKSMKEHVTGTTHTHKSSIVKAQEAKPRLRKRPMHRYVKQRSTVLNHQVDDVILNDQICLDRFSYLMVTKCGDNLRCQVCEVNVDDDALGYHLDTGRHERAMENTPVVCDLFGEFIREVRHEIYHCGFCNQVLGPWENVTPHFECEQHIASKAAAQRRLDTHLPGILQHRHSKERDFLNFMIANRLGI